MRATARKRAGICSLLFSIEASCARLPPSRALRQALQEPAGGVRRGTCRGSSPPWRGAQDNAGSRRKPQEVVSI
eukprot:10067921-Alexandrium_andersonii.AAC.1